MIDFPHVVAWVISTGRISEIRDLVGARRGV